MGNRPRTGLVNLVLPRTFPCGRSKLGGTAPMKTCHYRLTSINNRTILNHKSRSHPESDRGIQAWGRVLTGRFPALSIEITRECPLRCPGCYAYEDSHLGGSINLRQLADFKGEALIEGVLALARRYRPLHLSIVGGDPLVRFREVDVLLPKLNRMGIFVQLVTSAFRPIPLAWGQLSKLNLVVSIDGLQPEHDLRRAPATYERILRNITGHRVIIHCTVTGQMMKRGGYLAEFLSFWCPRSEIKKVWMSFFTPQKGDHSPECLTTAERDQAVHDLLSLRRTFPKLDMGEGTLREFAQLPQSPPNAYSR